jgi:hypothetical protein
MIFGTLHGFIAHVKSIASEYTSSHCISHCKTLAVRNIPNALKAVLDKAVMTVYFIQSRQMNSIIFSAVCDKMGNSYTRPLLHMEVQWFS